MEPQYYSDVADLNAMRANKEAAELADTVTDLTLRLAMIESIARGALAGEGLGVDYSTVNYTDFRRIQALATTSANINNDELAAYNLLVGDPS